jgi:predicted glutamine amidotransferase
MRTVPGWTIERGTSCAAACARYDAIAQATTHLMVAHVRKKTVGPTAIVNTHPFRRADFVFAHNGTVTAVAALIARSSQRRLAEIEGDTDSERLFAFVLTCVDEAGDVDRGVAAATRALHALGDIGSASFLLSCGSRIYAHRLGRALYRAARDDLMMIASEPLTTEPWTEIAERSLVVLDPEDLRRDLRAA